MAPRRAPTLLLLLLTTLLARCAARSEVSAPASALEPPPPPATPLLRAARALLTRQEAFAFPVPPNRRDKQILLDFMSTTMTPALRAYRSGWEEVAEAYAKAAQEAAVDRDRRAILQEVVDASQRARASLHEVARGLTPLPWGQDHPDLIPVFVANMDDNLGGIAALAFDDRICPALPSDEAVACHATFRPSRPGASPARVESR